MFDAYKTQGTPVLCLAGPYEFLADDPFAYGIYAAKAAQAALPPAQEARRALNAQALLNVDVGWLSPKAARWFTQSTGATPRGYQTVAEKPVSRIIKTNLGPVGMVLFPQGPTPGRGPTPAQEQQALAAGRALQAKSILVIGISPWGLNGEKQFLPKAQGVFACILGGGEGVAFAQSVSSKNPGVLWLRPDGQGRAVSVLEILEAPRKNTPLQWSEGLNFRASLLFLDDSFPSSPAMQRIVGPPRTEAALQ